MKRVLNLVLSILLAVAAAQAQGMSFGLQAARSSPEWVNRATIYQVWMRTFTPECTLKAVEARLPYIADLGASVIYMSPLHPGLIPYWIDDFNAIDPRYGTEADLKALIEAAHKLGLKVIMDMPLSQIGSQNKLLKRPGFLQTNKDGQLELSWRRLPLPNYNNPDVREYFVADLVHWVRDVKADGFRCDVAAYMPLEFWEQAREALNKVNPETLILGESDRPDDQLKAFDLNYNYAYYFALASVMKDGEKASRIREQWETAHSTYPRGARLVHFSDNHDQVRAVRQFGEKGAMAASVLNFTLDGVPFLYNGQEIADCTATPWMETKAIDLPSPPVKVDAQTADYRSRVASKDGRPAILATYKQLFQLRKEEPALTSGEMVWVNNTAPDSVLSFIRKKGDDQILVIVNLKNNSLLGSMNLPTRDYPNLKVLFSGGGALNTFLEKMLFGRVSFNLPAYGSLVVKVIPAPTK